MMGNLSTQNVITSYVDSDYYGDLDKRRSTTKFVFNLFGDVNSWRVVYNLLLLYIQKKLSITHYLKLCERSFMDERLY